MLSEKLLDGDGDLTDNGREVLKYGSQSVKFFKRQMTAIAFALDIATIFLQADKYGCLIEATTLASAIHLRRFHVCFSK